MTGFEVTTGQLQWAGSMLADLENEVRERSATLGAEVQGLLDAGWQGGAAAGFTRGWQQWQAGADEVLAALAQMGALLRTTGEQYTSVESANTAVTSAPGEGL